MKKLFIFLIGIFLSITSFGQLKQVEVPDTTAKDTVYVEQQPIINNYYNTDGMWYNYSPFRFNWYVDWYTPYSYSWYSPYYYDWYSPYNYNWYGWYSPYYHHHNYTHYNYNHYGHNSHYNTNYYGHRNVSSGYKPVNHNRYQYKKPIEYKPLYDHSQRHGIMPKYNESRPAPKYDNGTRVRQHIDMNPDNTRYRTPQPQRTYKPNRPADNPRPAMDRPQQRTYSPQPSNRPAPTHMNNAPQRSYSPQPSSRPPSNPAPSRMPNSGGRR
jgi:hypothetical protein